MPLDKALLNKILMGKEGYAPPGPMPGSPGMDPSMMDPSMMAAGAQAPGGAMPMPPGGGAPMDPAMMGGAPPMPDPAMMGGAPPMDPSMVGGLPPGGMPPGGDPMAGGGGDMGGMPIMLNAEDLMALFQQVAGQGGAPGAAPEDPAAVEEEDKSSGRVTNRELAEQVDELTTMIGQIMASLNITPASEVPGMGAAGPPPMDDMAGMPPPEDPGMGMPPPELGDMGIAPMDMPMQPQASDNSNKEGLLDILGKMNDYR